MIKGLRTVVYHVPDLAKAKDWYSSAFGVSPYFDEPFYVGFNVGGFELGLLPGAAADQAAGGVTAYWGVDDVDAALKQLESVGARRHEEPENVGGDIIVGSVLDPFGNVVGLIRNPAFDPKNVR